jgi:hypothetical protein
MKERGKYQIQCMKSRSSTGVGQKIDLDYNIETMRITDPGIDENASVFRKPSSSIMDSIRARSTVGNEESSEVQQDVPRVDADIQSAKLKQLLNKIKTG